MNGPRQLIPLSYLHKKTIESVILPVALSMKEMAPYQYEKGIFPLPEERWVRRYKGNTVPLIFEGDPDEGELVIVALKYANDDWLYSILTSITIYTEGHARFRCQCQQYSKEMYCIHCYKTASDLVSYFSECWAPFQKTRKEAYLDLETHQPFNDLTTHSFKKAFEAYQKESSSSTPTLQRFFGEPEHAVPTLELYSVEDELYGVLWLEKMGKKGRPIKSGRKPITVENLHRTQGSIFHRLPECGVSLSSKQCHEMEFYVDQRVPADHAVWKITNFHRLIELFNAGGRMIWSDRAPLKVGQSVRLLIGKALHDQKDPQDEAFFQFRVCSFDGEHLFDMEQPFNHTDSFITYDQPDTRGPLLGGNPPVFVHGDTIYPIDTEMHARDLYRFMDHFDTIDPEKLPPLYRKQFEQEVLLPLMVKGIHTDESLVTSPFNPQACQVKALWHLSFVEGQYRLKIMFLYQQMRVNPQESQTFVLDEKAHEIYNRDIQWERNHLEMLKTELKLPGPPLEPLVLDLDQTLFLVDELFVTHAQSVVLEMDESGLKISQKRPTISYRVESGIDWFDLEVDATLDDKPLPWKSVLQAVQKKARYILIDGVYYRTDPKEMKRLSAIVSKLKMKEASASVPWFEMDVLEDLASDKAVIPDFMDSRAGKLLKMVRDFSSIPDYPLPERLEAVLRPYQLFGYRWLRFLEDYRLNGILADDMGLGKTVQTIALLQSWLERHDRIRALVIAPKSVLENWSREIQRFAPDLTHRVYHGLSRKHEKLSSTDTIVWITTYATYRQDADRFAQIGFDFLILDEAQCVKNRMTLTFQHLRKLQAHHKIALTGTPIENSLQDIHAIYDTLMPGFLGSASGFTARYRSELQSLSQKVKPVLLRRKKEEVLKELPSKTIHTLPIEMELKQQSLYTRYLTEAREEIRNALSSEEGFQKQRFQVLTHLLRLRQIACHPALVFGDQAADDQSAKLNAMEELVEEILEEGHKVAIFSQFAQMLQLIRKRCDKRGWNLAYMDGSTRDRQSQIDRFQNDPDTSLFLLTLKVGGLGLNLTRASYVIIFDPWWNPAAEMQAIDRTHRIGQENPVMVYRLIASESVEEKVVTLQEEKKRLVRDVVDADINLSKGLTREDLGKLFSS